MIVLAVLLTLWIALIVVGLAIKAVLWLAAVGLVLFVCTVIAGAFYHTS